MKFALALSTLLFAVTGCLDSQVSDDVLTARTGDGNEVAIEVGEDTAQIAWDGQRAVLASTTEPLCMGMTTVAFRLN